MSCVNTQSNINETFIIEPIIGNISDFLPLSGGTVTGDTIFTSGLTANTIYATTYLNLPVTENTYTTGFTYNDNTFTIFDNSGSTFNAIINSVTGLTINGNLDATTISGGTLYGDGSNLTNVQNIYNTDGTLTGNRVLNGASNDLFFTNINSFLLQKQSFFQFAINQNNFTLTSGNLNDGLNYSTQNFVTGGRLLTIGKYQGLSPFINLKLDITNSVAGFSDGRDDTAWNYKGLKLDFVNSTYSLGDFDNTSGNTKIVIDDAAQTITLSNISAGTDSNVLTIDNQGVVHSFPLSGLTGGTAASGDYLPLSGGTVTGETIFQSGLTASSIYATSYLNLPLDVYVTGGTYTNGNIIFKNNLGGEFSVTGLPIGGIGGQLYYFNLSKTQDSYREFAITATTDVEQSTGVTISQSATSTIASFMTPIGYPGITLIPAGVWSFYLHSYKENSSASFDIFCEVYKIDTGATETLLLVTDPAIVTSDSPTPRMQISDGYYSGSSINSSDRIVIKVRATNKGNQSNIITFFTEGPQHYSYGSTPFSSVVGLTCDTLSGCSVINDIQISLNNKADFYYQNTTPTGTGTAIIITGSTWEHSDTGIEYIYINDGDSYQWIQQTLPQGTGPIGPNGPNNISTGTTTDIVGILKGNGINVSAATPDVDYQSALGFTPENVTNKETVALDGSNTKYPTNNVVNTALQSFSDDVDYAIMINQRILFKF